MSVFPEAGCHVAPVYVTDTRVQSCRNALLVRHQRRYVSFWVWLEDTRLFVLVKNFGELFADDFPNLQHLRSRHLAVQCVRQVLQFVEQRDLPLDSGVVGFHQHGHRVDSLEKLLLRFRLFPGGLFQHFCAQRSVVLVEHTVGHSGHRWVVGHSHRWRAFRPWSEDAGVPRAAAQGGDLQKQLV